jgi:DNA-binding Lrp family transcriptional regulator
MTRPHAARRLYDHLAALPRGHVRHQTPAGMAEALGVSRSWLYRCLRRLEEAGCVTVERPTPRHPWWVVEPLELRGATLTQVIRYAAQARRRYARERANRETNAHITEH